MFTNFSYAYHKRYTHTPRGERVERLSLEKEFFDFATYPRSSTVTKEPSVCLVTMK